MKVPLSWLREYVDVDLPVAKLIERLTFAGLEVGGVRVLGLPVPEGVAVKQEDLGPVWDADKVVISRVLKVERHPNADRLTVVTLDYGKGEKTVVTGAPNVKVGDQGQKVILGLTGTSYFDGHDKEKGRTIKQLKPGKIRGVDSDAMVMSEYELGISEEFGGIILLEDEAPVGMPLAEYMGDVVLELDVLPNMARCLSMIGVAREVAALTGKELKLPARTLQGAGPDVAGKVEVVIEDAKLSARYAAALLQGVKVGPSPGWMQRRLTYAGMRPINNIVDITNFVMLEWGQPLHAFDYDLLAQRAGGKTPTITVRPARTGESIKTLDGNQRPLSHENLVIADGVGPIAVAGVMGGANTEVSEKTTNILLESANFDFVSVRRTMKAMNLPSEASIRFSKGIHPELVKPAAERAAGLMEQHAGAMVGKGLVDRYPAPLPPQVIELSMAQVTRSLGMNVAPEEATRILSALAFRVEPAGADRLRVTVPPHRLDIQAGAADLIEELARVHGYDHMPATLLADRLPAQHGNRALQQEERVKDILVSAGLQEIITYALTEPKREQPLDQPAEAAYVTLKNPISSERVVMRRTLLGGAIEVAERNLKHTGDVRIFEVGSVYLPRNGEALPDEPRRLSVLMTGRRHAEYWADAGAAGATLEFFDLKGVVEALAADLHLPEVSYRPASTTYLHPGRSAELLLGGNPPVGVFGQLHPKVAEGYGLGNRMILVGEFDLDAILAAVPDRFPYTPVLTFPAALRDIAVIVERDTTSERVVKEIRAAGGNLLRAARLFDVYQGESIPAGTRSLAYALTYQADDRTLTDKEVDKAHKKIEDRLKHVLKAQIRGQDAAK